MEFMMVRQKIKRVWDAAPRGFKCAFGIMAGVVGFLFGLTTDDDENELSEDTFTEMYLDEKGNVTHEPTPTEYDPWGTHS
ncbi:MAG: hypothetical protein JMN25_10335 [gamma proteobacterium endosymbiont of Lamellibrachia anaximandri]|nr:hypothetical protein [gamma proteobacterium endosymbiont of Lamellibrachia anaximandri]